MGIRKVNVLDVELDESLDRAGLRHSAAGLGDRLGARRIGASVYRAEPGSPIWPYHYHHGIEEWLHVLTGAPVLREPAGERVLGPGDLVCFPSGHAGAHTLSGPGRFVIFATGGHAGPYLSVYPDSDKVSGPQGILLRGSAVGYWHGEGTEGASEDVEIARARFVVVAPARRRRGSRPSAAGRATPAHGTPAPGHGPRSVHPRGEDPLEAGDLVCFPEGPSGAHQLLSPGGEAVRALLISTTGLPANAYYPDSGLWLVRNGPGQREVVLRDRDAGQPAGRP